MTPAKAHPSHPRPELPICARRLRTERAHRTSPRTCREARPNGTSGAVARTRSLLTPSPRFLGDYQAVKNGRIAKRLARRAVGRVTGRAGRIFR
jgi:hypothetical protein